MDAQSAAFPMRCLPGPSPGKDKDKERPVLNRAGGDPGWKPQWAWMSGWLSPSSKRMHDKHS